MNADTDTTRISAVAQFRVLVAVPTRRDAEVTSNLLSKEGLDCSVLTSVQAIAEQLSTEVGAVILTDLALMDPAFGQLASAMRQQPSSSDIPTLLLTRERGGSQAAASALASLSNVTLLDRPSSTRSMVSAVKAALRARQRQYEIRDQLEARRNAEAALRDADVRKDEFLATLAHELRNPLAAIRTGLAVLDRTSEDPRRTAHIVGMVDRQSRMLVKLIDDLMDVSRIATGKVIIQQELIDFRAVLELGLEAGQTLFNMSRHDFRLDLPSGPVWIRGDSSRLAQVVGNLVQNAGKYTPDGGRIAVALSQDNGAAVLRIIDTGAGIPTSQLDAVFEMFTQVDRTLDRSRGGLGIGLSLVRRLVELHGGTVTAHSLGVGTGSTFTVRLPMVTPDANEGPDADLETNSPATRRLNILVVDDNRDLADGLSALLAHHGHRVKTAYNGGGALEMADGFHLDIVFCDIGMAGANGHEVARALRAGVGGKALLLVAVTGWGSQEDRRLSFDAGFDIHLTKPVSAEQVEGILARF